MDLQCSGIAMYEGGSCSDLGTAGPLDLKRGQLMSGRLSSSSSHNIKEELTSSGAVEWPAGCGYRLPSWGAAAAPFDPIKGGVERVKVPAAELGRDRAAAYFSPGLYLSRDPLQPSGPPQRDAADQDKRISDECDTYVHQRLVDLKDIVSTEICQLETQWGYPQWRHAYHPS
ncbi:hypothetical protein FJT64_020359 [Amphibalanus amphitrite]|uniref:Uncharacterized protein n=1 Tax=Amphibalanus amphitrite TaxID=1232801 RepID=A0A6A4WLV6_AMPAM|nr:hypothetical protein FJT64_020359 [Amphibalanus amphitrite]